MNTKIRYGYLQTATMGTSISFKFILERRVAERSSLGKDLLRISHVFSRERTIMYSSTTFLPVKSCGHTHVHISSTIYCLQGRLRNGPERECVSECLDGPEGSDGHVVELSASWSGNCPSKAARWFSSFRPLSRRIISYKKFMGGVDRGNQLRGYYSCRTKSRKFYKYIFTFLLDVAITNSFLEALLSLVSLSQHQELLPSAGKIVDW